METISEQVRVLHRQHITQQTLEKMMVGLNQPRHHNTTRQVNPCILLLCGVLSTMISPIKLILDKGVFFVYSKYRKVERMPSNLFNPYANYTTPTHC